jgi:chaperonin GroES
MAQVTKTPMPQVAKTPMTQATKIALRPLHDRLLVKRLEGGDEKHGSIIIPDSAKEKPQEGKVIAAGNGKVTEDGKKLALDVKTGDRILFGKYSGSEVKLNGKEYLIMKEEDVLGILSA